MTGRDPHEPVRDECRLPERELLRRELGRDRRAHLESLVVCVVAAFLAALGVWIAPGGWQWPLGLLALVAAGFAVFELVHVRSLTGQIGELDRDE